MEVGREIRRIREAKRWPQAKLAAAADMAVSGVSQIETGARNPSAVTLSKIADALDVEVADLFPKAESPLPLPDFEEQSQGPVKLPTERRAVFADVITDAAEYWLQTGPPTSQVDYEKLLGIIDFVLTIEDSMGTRLGDSEWWRSLSNEGKHEFMRIEKLLTQVTGELLAQVEEGVARDEAPIKLEEFRRRKEAVEEHKHRKSASA